MRISNSFSEAEITGMIRLLAMLDRVKQFHHILRSDAIVSFRRKLLSMRDRIDVGRAKAVAELN